MISISLILSGLNASAAAKTESVKTRGIAYAVTVSNDLVSFCDEAGAHALKLPEKTEAKASATCAGRAAPYEPNTCSGLTVSSPNGSANDTVETDTWSVRVSGRVHACAENAGVFAVATGSNVSLISENGEKSTVDRAGAEDIWFTERWLVWARANALAFKKVR